ncbi:alpha/beta hydrolase [Dyella telluris]|uniref:Alpha/beta hydrolase n=2 Tax=Dyella telluris TaxID=2763498 RepID=A0A7G8QA33_9GAMM|nr:alpha/beta hydrolase [Dyella telluris]
MMRSHSANHTEQLPTSTVETAAGSIRLYDSGKSAKPSVIMVPDGPNVIEHCAPLIRLLESKVRVICFDMPGFGYSIPATSHLHSLNQGAQLILSVMDSLGIGSATLAFSCANGFYALNAARMEPARVTSLMLSQTPSLVAMHAWVGRIIPRPLLIPIVGQIATWLFRRKLITRWYPAALPRTANVSSFRERALDAISHGACFCLAGVVQGLTREAMPPMDDMKTPCTMVWGGGDPSHTVTDPLSLLHLVPHAKVITFKDCGHFPDIERHTRFSALLLEQVMRYA